MKKGLLNTLVIILILSIMPFYINAVDCTYSVYVFTDSATAISGAAVEVYYYNGSYYTYVNATTNSSGLATVTIPNNRQIWVNVGKHGYYARESNSYILGTGTAYYNNFYITAYSSYLNYDSPFTFSYQLPYQSADQCFGYRRMSGMDYHAGIDISNRSDGVSFSTLNPTTISVSSGTISRARWDDNAGNYVAIYDGSYYSYYMHLAYDNVTEGNSINKGNLIGTVGTTGSSTGVHLHLGITTTLSLNPDNGYWLDPFAFIY